MIKDSMFVKAEVAANEKEHIAAPASSMIADAWARLRKNKAAVVSLGILIVIILLAIFPNMILHLQITAMYIPHRPKSISSDVTSLDETYGPVYGWEPEFP